MLLFSILRALLLPAIIAIILSLSISNNITIKKITTNSYNGNNSDSIKSDKICSLKPVNTGVLGEMTLVSCLVLLVVFFTNDISVDKCKGHWIAQCSGIML